MGLEGRKAEGKRRTEIAEVGRRKGSAVQAKM